MKLDHKHEIFTVEVYRNVLALLHILVFVNNKKVDF